MTRKDLLTQTLQNIRDGANVALKELVFGDSDNNLDTTIPKVHYPEFPKIARLSRNCFVTEKIDGTNGLISIDDTGTVIRAGSRTKWITPADDNCGFAKWVQSNREELLQLGPGNHYGEWWGAGIQRKYGLTEKRFSLFNVSLWRDVRPSCCHVVPVLYEGPFSTGAVDMSIAKLVECGSVAAPGFMKPEGVVVYHIAGSGTFFKKTIERDEEFKGKA